MQDPKCPSGYTLKEIAEYQGLYYTTVNREIEKAEEDYGI